MKKLILLFLLTAIIIIPAETAKSGNLTLPNSFSTGQLIQAADMNANFNAVETAIDDNDSRISTNAGAISGKQNDVTNSCLSGEAIRIINDNGTVTCVAVGSGGGGDITAVITPSGSGLSGGRTSGDVTLSIASGGVTATHIATGAVGYSEIASGAVRSSEIATGAVGSSEIANSSITGTDIANGTITGSDIASGSIPTSDITGDAGIDYAIFSAGKSLSGSIRNLGYIDFSYPAAGYILIQFNGYIRQGDNTDVQVGISTSTSIWSFSEASVRSYKPGFTLSKTFRTPFHVQRVHYVTGRGARRFFAIGMHVTGTGAYVYQGNMVATFFPKHY